MLESKIMKCICDVLKKEDGIHDVKMFLNIEGSVVVSYVVKDEYGNDEKHLIYDDILF